MKLDDLRLIGPAELADLKEKQDAATRKSAAEHALNTEASRLYNIALHCIKLGVWIGDKVQIIGKLGGKENPIGQLAGFQNPGMGDGWPMVYLQLKNGKFSDTPSRVYGSQKITKL